MKRTLLVVMWGSIVYDLIVLVLRFKNVSNYSGGGLKTSNVLSIYRLCKRQGINCTLYNSQDGN